MQTSNAPLSAASTVWSLSGMLCSAYDYFSSSSGTQSSFENRLEEFGLLVSLAALKRLPEGSKPSRSNHRITWDPPVNYQPTGGTTVNSQGAKRRLCHTLGVVVAKHTDIIPLWPREVENAVKLHFPKDLMTQDPLIAQTKLQICKDAIDGLDRLKTTTYRTTADGTVDQLALCIKTLSDALNQIEMFGLLQASQDSKSEAAPSSPDQTSEEKKPAMGRVSIDVLQKSGSAGGAQSGRVASVADEIATLWQERCLFETLQILFKDADAVPIAERDKSVKFTTSLLAIDSLLSQRGSLYEEILNNSSKY